MNLSELELNQDAVIRAVGGRGGLRRHLLDMGLTEGARVECLHRSPLGDPAAYAIRGAVVALRDCDSARIAVAPVL